MIAQVGIPDADGAGTAVERARARVDALARVLSATLVETHISWVLLYGDRVLKIKKPVRFAFVDFGTLERRRQMCEEEVRLNRRLAPSLYLGVLPITAGEAGPRVGGDGEAVEWAVSMRRFPPGALLAEQARDGTLAAATVEALARRLARFHEDAERARPESTYGTPAVIEAAMEGVLAGLANDDAAPDMVALRQWAGARAQALRDVWLQRRAQGRVRDGHGDLHLANCVVIDGEVTAFDCLEFDPAMRWTDVMADIAFTVMDLDAHGRADLAARFVDAYLTESGDFAGLAVLRYYVVYRALVRALVGRLAHSSRATDYLNVARRWMTGASPRLAIMQGVSGSGKSHVALRLAERCGAIRLRSDVERKRLLSLPALASTHGCGEAYGAELSRRTYARLRDLAEGVLRAGWPVVVDATFLSAAERARFRQLAVRLRVPFSIIVCDAPREVLVERLRERNRQGGDPSEADEAVLALQLQGREPLSATEAADAIVVRRSDGVFDGASAAAACWFAAPPALEHR